MTDINYGRHSSEARVDWGFIAPGQMRGCTYNKTTDNIWAYQLGIWAGRYTTLSSTNNTIRIGVYETNSSKNPTNRLGYGDSDTISSTMNDQTGGSSNTSNVSVIDVTPPTGVTFSAIPLESGTRYHLAVLSTTGYMAHAMQQAALITKDNEAFYNRTSLSQPPPDPYGSYSSSTEGHMTMWAVCEVNVAPDTPTNLSPSGSINDTAPTFTADFVDDNEARGDYLNQYKIQVRRVSDAVSFWDTTVTASSSERTADAISKAYAGTTLVRGTAYEWRCQMSDHFGTWSDWTAWTSFTPANLGFVTLGDDPTGKIEDNTPDFDGTWTHQSAADMTHVQIRLLNAAGTTVLQTGSQYDLTDVNDTDPFTVAWANTGFTTLAWGTTYQFQIRGYDGSQWSDWSAAQSFSTNAAPSIPSGLDPANSAILTDYPLLTCTSTDADDTTGTGFVVYARIKDSGGSVLSTETMTYNGTTGKWEFQTSASELTNSYDDYRWDAYSYDGTLYSGEQTTSGAATKSTEALFTYALGPTVTITSPTEAATITTANLPVTWTTTDQQKYRVYLYADGTSTVVYDSGETVSTTSSHTIPSGYLVNDTSYDLVVWAEDSNPLEGTSAVRNISVDYVEPDVVANFVATPDTITTDLWESVIRLTWDATTYGTDVWQEYTIRRQAASGPDATSIILARITSPSQVAYVDYTPVSGVEYTYTMTQDILTGLDTLTSEAATASATVELGGVVITSITNPDSIRTALKYTNERDHGREIDETVYQPLSGAAPTTVRTPQRTKTVRFEAQVFDDDEATAAARKDELEAIDESRHTLCYRDNHGRKMFCTMPDLQITDQVPDWFTAAIDLRLELYTEGVV